jgi:thioredoxin reductase
VTLICRGNSLENNMSSYLIRQLGERPSITARFQSEVVAAQGELALEAVEIRDNATGNVERQESGGLFIFVGADAETAWLPQEIALTPAATFSPVRTRPATSGSSSAIRICSRRVCPGSSPAAMSARAP